MTLPGPFTNFASFAILVSVLTGSVVHGALLTDYDQYALELINRARANPQAEADRYLSGNLNEGLSPGTITTTAKQPLAFDPNLNDAAEGHTTYLINNDLFTHTGDGGTDSNQRMANAGYTFSGSWGSAENLGAVSSSGIDAAVILQMHIGLFVDGGIPGRGHRINMMIDDFESVGIDTQHTPSFGPLGGLAGALITQNFAYSDPQGPFITGVAFDDLDMDDFYTPGEGLGGLAVTAFETGTMTVAGSTTTMDTGGYTLQLAAGTYDLQILGPLGAFHQTGIIVGTQNQKFDYNNVTITSLPEPTSFFLLVPAVAGLAFYRRRRAATSGA